MNCKKSKGSDFIRKQASLSGDVLEEGGEKRQKEKKGTTGKPARVVVSPDGGVPGIGKI